MMQGKAHNFYHNPNAIPKKIHYVWLGKKPIPNEAISNIIRAAFQNRDYSITLWTDNPYQLQNTILAKGYSCIFFKRIDIKRPFLTPEVTAAINRECTDNDFRNYAAASDIMRLAILYEHGGIYLDVDVVMQYPLGEIKPQRQSRTGAINCLICAIDSEEGKDYSNAVIAAVKNSGGIKKILKAAVAPYRGKIPELGFLFTRGRGVLAALLKEYKGDGVDIDYLMWQGKRQVPTLRHEATVAATGPGLLYSYLKATSLTRKQKQTKLMQGTDNFGQRPQSRNAFLGSWQQGMNADGKWVSPELTRKISEI